MSKTQNTIYKTQTKHKAQNPKTQTKHKSKSTKHKMKSSNYRDLEERTLLFAKQIIKLCKALPKDTIKIELIKQIMRAGCSIGANYREANEALGKKDLIHRLRIARKEAKETHYWLELISEADPQFKAETESLMREVQELRNILTAIIEKSK